MESLLDSIKLISDRLEKIKELSILTGIPEIDNIPLKNDYLQILGNTELSNLYNQFHKWVPQCTTLYDDRIDRDIKYGDLYMSMTIKFPTQYVRKNLPVEMNKFLIQYNINDTTLEIFVRIQTNQILGEEQDHKSDNKLTTRIRPHGWIDPNLPENFEGNYLQRNVLVGIFDVDDVNMSNEVEINKMKPFALHLHDNQASPRGMGVGIIGKKNSISESFWSLIIDHNPNTGTRPNPLVNLQQRAIATLHWIYTPQSDWEERAKASFPVYVPKTDLENDLLEHYAFRSDNYYEIKINTWKELYSYLKKK